MGTSGADPPSDERAAVGALIANRHASHSAHMSASDLGRSLPGPARLRVEGVYLKRRRGHG